MKHRKRHLDFIIIGAQKSGTTTLYKYLNEHPHISMPSDKEAPYFTDDTRYPEGFNSYLAETYLRSPANSLWGKVTPSYLVDPCVALRIKALIPTVKLIVILRDPIERTFSHYLMSYRRGIETRTFPEAIKALLKDDILSETRACRYCPEAETRCYIVWSEYGRLLNAYLDFILRGQLLILFTDELAKDPQRLLDKTMVFLGLEKGFVPKNLGRRYHAGGTRLRFPSIYGKSRALLESIGIWRLLPSRWQKTLDFWSELWRIVPLEQEARKIDSEIFERLRDHFQSDISLFERTTGMNVPWATLRSTPFI